MHHFDATNAECSVYSFREGVLSAVGHDLALRAGAFAIDVDPDSLAVTARLDTRALRVLGAVVDGREKPGALSARDLAEIEQHLARDVLDTARYPEARFRSSAVTPLASDAGYRIRGTLELHGQAREIELAARRAAGRLVAEFVVHQPDFGIKPFRAMLGALKIRPDVKVVVSVPWSGG